MALFNFLVEGDVDEAVARKIAAYTGHELGICYGKRGYGYIRNKIRNFNLSAQGMCFLTLVDLMDTRLDCPGAVISQWLPNRHSNMLFRIVVREIESWLLADRESIAEFLHVNKSMVPTDVENLFDPKQELINIARRSRNRQIQENLVPHSSSATEGILYNTEMTRYVRDFWRIEIACENSHSLERCVIRLNEFNG